MSEDNDKDGWKRDSACLFCGAEHHFAGSIDADRAPKDGDVSVCIECAKPSIFTDDGARLPTLDELKAMGQELDVVRHISAVLLANAWADVQRLENEAS